MHPAQLKDGEYATIGELQQILLERGLVIDADPAALVHYLTTVGHYRLSEYYTAFSTPDKKFISETAVKKLIELYKFDRRLRLLLLGPLEKIEVALRALIIEAIGDHLKKTSGGASVQIKLLDESLCDFEQQELVRVLRAYLKDRPPNTFPEIRQLDQVLKSGDTYKIPNAIRQFLLKEYVRGLTTYLATRPIQEFPETRRLHESLASKAPDQIFNAVRDFTGERMFPEMRRLRQALARYFHRRKIFGKARQGCERDVRAKWTYRHESDLPNLTRADRETRFKNHFENLPAWDILHCTSFGPLAYIFDLLDSKITTPIAERFGVVRSVLVSILYALRELRNACAHHEPIWNWRPKKSELMFPSRYRDRIGFDVHQKNSLYVYCASIHILLSYLSRGESTWYKRLKKLDNEYDTMFSSLLGFPDNWQTRPFWCVADVALLKQAEDFRKTLVLRGPKQESPPRAPTPSETA